MPEAPLRQILTAGVRRNSFQIASQLITQHNRSRVEPAKKLVAHRTPRNTHWIRFEKRVICLKMCGKYYFLILTIIITIVIKFANNKRSCFKPTIAFIHKCQEKFLDGVKKLKYIYLDLEIGEAIFATKKSKMFEAF